MFRRSLKKRQKLLALLAMLGRIDGERCLLVTCGDNTGALNWHFRAAGGDWAWAEAGHHVDHLEEMTELLGAPVLQVPDDRLPFGDQEFDRVVAIDVLEHLRDDQPFLRELRRVLRPEGRAVVTVPNGDPTLVVNRLRWRVGMSPEVYGHTRAGYTLDELRASVHRAGFAPLRGGGYSRVFTELVELAINVGYVFVLSRRKGGAEPGRIAPTSAGELQAHGAAYRLYALALPLLRAISRLDRLLPTGSPYAVIVEAAPAA